MTVLRGLLGLIAGTLAAVVLGAIADYLVMRNVLPDGLSAYLAMPPWTAGIGGLVAALIAVLIAAPKREPRAAHSGTARTTPYKAQPQASRPAQTAATPTPAARVDGMPSFDFKSAADSAAAERQAASRPDKEAP